MALVTSEESSKLVYWIMSALLTIAIAAIGFFVKDLHSRIEANSAREAARYEAMNSSQAQRGERMATYEVKLATIEPRLTSMEGKLSQVEPRMPLLESKITTASDRLQRIEEKLDRLLQGRGAGR